MIIKVVRNYLEINSIKDLKTSKIPNENCKLTLIDPPDFLLNRFLIIEKNLKKMFIAIIVKGESFYLHPDHHHHLKIAQAAQEQLVQSLDRNTKGLLSMQNNYR